MQKKRTFKAAFTCRWAPSDGADGKDGVGIKSADVVFCQGTSDSEPPADGETWVTLFSQLRLVENLYVWSCTKTELTDGTTSYTGKQCLGPAADFAEVTEQYAVGSSGTSAPASGWGADYTPTKEMWLWTRNRMKWANGTFSHTAPICIGYFGKDGTDGKYTVYDFALSSRKTAGTEDGCPDDILPLSWSASPKEPTAARPYVWMRIRRYGAKSEISGGLESTAYARVTGEDGANGAYTDYTFNIARENTSSGPGTPPSHCAYSEWQDAPVAVTADYPYLWMRMERKDDPDSQAVGYVCMTGAQGSPGEEGNGISSQVSYFVATDRVKVASYGAVSGWSEVFPAATEQMPYIWKCVKTTYTRSAATFSTPELITTYHSGDNANIIDNAAFTDASNMAAWSVKSSYMPLSGKTAPSDTGRIDTAERKDSRNSYYDTCKATGASITTKKILEQAVHCPSNGVSKLGGGQWYTFSFWAKGGQQTIEVNETSNLYGFAARSLYLVAGRTYRIEVCGSVKETKKELRTYIHDSGWTQEAYVRINTGYMTTASMTFTPNATGVHEIISYMYDSDEPRTGTVTVYSYSITDSQDLNTYIYPTAVDTDTKMIVDGVEQGATAADLGVSWALTGQWERHTVTFKTKAVIPDSDSQRVLFRFQPAPNGEAYRQAWICMPKLENGMFATGFVDGIDDLRGIPGLVERTSEWSAGTEYHNDETLTLYGGIRYLDIVTVTDSTTGSFAMYQCRVTHISTAANAPDGGDSAEWLKLNQMRPIYTPLIVASNAVLRFAQTNRILVTNSENKVQGCFGGVEDETNGYPLWIGGATAADAKFKVKYGGQLEATGASIIDATAENLTVTGSSWINEGRFCGVKQSDGTVVGGFQIGRNGLTYDIPNEWFEGGDWKQSNILIRNTTYGFESRVGASGDGTNYFTASSFKLHTNNQLPGSIPTANAAIYAEASGADSNFALTGVGDIMVEGTVDGFAYSCLTLNGGSTIYDFAAYKTRCVVKITATSSLYLPTSSMIRNYLVRSSVKFAMRLTICSWEECAPGGQTLWLNVAGRADSGTYSSANLPVLYKDGVRTDKVPLVAEGVADILLVHDGSEYKAFVISLNSRYEY